MTCAEVNNLGRNKFVPKLLKFYEICAEALVPKFIRAEVRLPVHKRVHFKTTQIWNLVAYQQRFWCSKITHLKNAFSEIFQIPDFVPRPKSKIHQTTSPMIKIFKGKNKEMHLTSVSVVAKIETTPYKWRRFGWSDSINIHTCHWTWLRLNEWYYMEL